MKKKIVFIICFLFGIISVKNVYAASLNKSLRTTCAGTSARVTATYYTHETTRWKISNPFNIGYSGRGGYASKSGKPQTSKSGSVYKCSQRVSFSSTDYNSVTRTGYSTYYWEINGNTNKWGSCYTK